MLFVVFCMIHYMDERTIIIPIASWYPTSSRMVFPELLSRLRKPIYAWLPACLLYLFDSLVSFLKRMGAAIESALGLIFLRSSTLNRCWMTKSYLSTSWKSILFKRESLSSPRKHASSPKDKKQLLCVETHYLHF